MLKRIQFRLWHLFLITGLVATLAWCYSRTGLQDAVVRIEYCDMFKTEDGFLGNVTLQFEEPAECRRTVIRLSLEGVDESTLKVNPLTTGEQVHFTYRARRVWPLSVEDPNEKLLRSLFRFPKTKRRPENVNVMTEYVGAR